MRWTVLFAGLVAATTPASADVFVVSATFTPTAESPYRQGVVTGAVDITGGLLTAGDFDIPGFPHFTLAFYSSVSSGNILQGFDFPWVDQSKEFLGQNLLTVMLPLHTDMLHLQSAPIVFGYLFHYTTDNGSAGRYWGTDFSGSVTPAEPGYQYIQPVYIPPPPVPHSPGPVLGAGLPGLLLLLGGLLAWWRRGLTGAPSGAKV